MLAPLQDMTVLGIDTWEGEEHLRLTIEFSDDLDRHRDIAGLVTVEPQLEIQLKSAGKTVVVSGEFGHGQTYTLTVHPGITRPMVAILVGYQAASLRYFQKMPEHLTWGEASTLPVLPNAPGLISPLADRDGLRTKRNRLLRKLLGEKIVDDETPENPKRRRAGGGNRKWKGQGVCRITGLF